ncbi:MAG: M23 family metallopeptidase [Alphaproteobacteria bacterium]|nr:M23 family metallopeptidase [Alphaproteobacteria bacterium]MDE2111199.1 M23 family metallopeptidase [Alphaproteobacteria bacterium]MDE2496017.1 M23 family metallopeptidase [Alphaproteobacteria bacterium]
MRIARREFLAAGVAAVLTPNLARADGGTRLSFRGSTEQGGLVIGKAAPGAKISVDGASLLVSPQGDFAFGFSYDRVDAAHVVAQFADGTSEARDVSPVVRQYETQSINGLPEKFVSPSPEELARIHREASLIVEARKRDTDGVGFDEPLDWPFPGIITGVYGSRRILDGTPMAPHLGVDIAAPEGTPIHAAADAAVSIADDYYLDGGFTLLDHGHGVSTCYLHQSKRFVKAGDKVARGDVIGLVGQTGRATGPHTHWGLCWFQVKLDPSRSTLTPEPPKA